MWPGLLDLLFPRACCGCGARPVAGVFCRGCAALVETPPFWRCPRCAGPLPPPTARAERPAACDACRALPPAFDRVVAPFVHGGAVAQAIYRLKYRGRREVARGLAPLLVGPAAGILASVDRLAPIPLHPDRRRERGYDQALLLAAELARLARRPLARKLVARRVPTRRQVGLTRPERERNVKGAFAASPGAAGLRIALVDDVVTTGATASAAARALKEAGAREVIVLALARAGA